MEEVTVWLEGVKRNDPRSQEEIWNAYYQKLVGLALNRIRALRSRESDEEDIALSAFNSFFRAVEEKRLPKLDDRDDLWKILIVIAARKISTQRKRAMAEKRGAGKVRGESVFASAGDDGQLGGVAQVMGSEPTPEFAALAAESCEVLLNELTDEMLRKIATLKLEGYTNREIADQLGVVERSVERKLSRIRSIWSAGSEEARKTISVCVRPLSLQLGRLPLRDPPSAWSGYRLSLSASLA